MKYKLKTGTLKTKIEYGDINFKVESRMNKKRGFIFVSKVLGKHIPVKIDKLLEVPKKLNEKLGDIKGRTLFIGFAETATGLAQNIFEYSSCKDKFYIQTTRVQLNKQIFLKFEEEHCHAPSHIIYQPNFSMKNFDNLVLIDDELSTGNTCFNIIQELKKKMNFKNIYVVSILNWMKDFSKFKNIKFIQLVKGEFEFTPNDKIIENKNITSISKQKNLDNLFLNNYGRFGVKKLEEFKTKINFYKKSSLNCLELLKLGGDNYKNWILKDYKKVLVLGYGEFMYIPQKIASVLQNNNPNSKIYSQTTSRSPLFLKDTTQFKDIEDIDFFIYNLNKRKYDLIITVYETKEQRLPHNFTKVLLDKKICNNIVEIFC